MTELEYQTNLTSYLNKRLARVRAWPVKGRKTTFLGRSLYPDLEFESDIAGRLDVIAIVELKVRGRLNLYQPMLYAILKNAPAYCIVDGKRRTSIRWFINPLSSKKNLINQKKFSKVLYEIKIAIEDFNYNNFI